MITCPVGHTCPSINKAIDILHDAMAEINEAVKQLERLSTETDFEGIEEMEGEIDDAKWNADTGHSRLSDVESLLEDLREENSQLREWGNDLNCELQDAENKINELELQET